MNLPVYELSKQLYSTLSQQDRGVEAILIADRAVTASPRRLFLVRYVIGEGGGGESKRPVFKSELTGFDHEMKITYATQIERLESFNKPWKPTYTLLSKRSYQKSWFAILTSSEEIEMKAIISEELVSKLVDLYEYAW